MSTRYRNLLYVFIILLVLIGSLVFLLLYNPNKNSDVNLSSISSSTEIALSNRSSSDILYVNIINSHGEYTVEKDNDKWKVNGLEKYPQSNKIYDSFISNSSVIAADSKIEDYTDNLEKYGLLSPQSSIKIKFTDDSYFELHIGNIAPDKSGYYAKVKDSNSIYLIKDVNASMFLESKLQFINKQLVANVSSGSSPSITSLDIINEGQDKITVVKNDELDLTSDENKSKISYAYKFISPAEVYADNSKIETILMSMYGLTATDVVELSPNNSKLSEYGLSNPNSTVILKADGNTYKLLIGKLVDNKDSEESDSNQVSSYYIMLDGIDVVYTADLTSLPWLSFDYKKSISPSIISPFIDNLKNISIKVDESEYLTDFFGEGDNLNVKINGKDIDTKRYKEFYKFLISTPIIDLSLEKPNNSTKIRIEFVYRKDIHSNDLLEFIPYSERKMGAVLNNKTIFIVNRSYIERMLENILKIANNEDIIDAY